MNNKWQLLAYSLLSLQLTACLSARPSQKIEFTVRDEVGEPIKNAQIIVVFPKYHHEDNTEQELHTDKNGTAQITGRSHSSPWAIVRKNGFYPSEYSSILVVRLENWDQLLAQKALNITLRQIRNPRPLIAKRVHELPIPLENEWVGYDLELGDWVEPQGTGERADLLIRYDKKFLGYTTDEEGLEKVRKRRAHNNQPWNEELAKYFYGDWIGNLEIRFPGEKEGILPVTETNGYVPESQLRMPHLAPEDGYQPTIVWRDVRFAQAMPRNGDGHFLRLRVRERNDQILESNYAKINEEIRLDPRGKISFTYYFNPDVNDRNLEFNPEQNLLPVDEDEAKLLP